MNALDIVKAYLKEHGFDGLCADECGCTVDDLQPCGEDFSQCVPGYKRDTPNSDTGFDFIIEPAPARLWET